MKLTVEVEAKLVEERFQEVFRRIQAAAALPGFREGRAPLDLVEKKFSKEAVEEVLKFLVPEVYHQCVVKHKLAPVSLPRISEIQMKRGSDLSFMAEFENTPEFSVRNYKGIRIKRVSMEVLEEDVEKGIESLREFRSETVPGIQEKRIPVLDDTFAKSFGKETVEELKEALRKDLARYKASESQNRMKEELFQKLLGLVSFAVPESLVEKQKERLGEAFAKAKDQVKLYFILQKIADLEEIEVDEFQLEERLNVLAEESKRPLEEVRRVFESDMRESMVEKKVIDFLLANAKLEDAELGPKGPALVRRQTERSK